MRYRQEKHWKTRVFDECFGEINPVKSSQEARVQLVFVSSMIRKKLVSKLNAHRETEYVGKALDSYVSECLMSNRVPTKDEWLSKMKSSSNPWAEFRKSIFVLNGGFLFPKEPIQYELNKRVENTVNDILNSVGDGIKEVNTAAYELIHKLKYTLTDQIVDIFSSIESKVDFEYQQKLGQIEASMYDKQTELRKMYSEKVAQKLAELKELEEKANAKILATQGRK